MEVNRLAKTALFEQSLQPFQEGFEGRIRAQR